LACLPISASFCFPKFAVPLLELEKPECLELTIYCYSSAEISSKFEQCQQLVENYETESAGRVRVIENEQELSDALGKLGLDQSGARKSILLVDGWESIASLDIPNSLSLIVFEKARGGSKLPEKSLRSDRSEAKLKILSKLSMLIVESVEDKAYFWGWLIQAGHSPLARGLVVEADNLVAADVKASLEPVERDRASFGRAHLRASVSGEIEGEYFRIDGGKLKYSFVFPSDHVNKVGIRLKSKLVCEVKLLTSSGIELDQASYTGSGESEVVWLSPARRGLASKRPSGGERASLVISSSGSVGNTFPVEVLGAVEQKYPGVFAKGIGVSSRADFSPYLYTIADEFGYLERSKVLLRRAVRMVAEGEWTRFSYALSRRVKGSLSWLERKVQG